MRSAIGEFEHSTSDLISQTLIKEKSAIEEICYGIAGRIKYGDADFWRGGFIGMSEAGKEELKSAIRTYIENIQEAISIFDTHYSIKEGIKGTAINEALDDFIRSVKMLLQSYVDLLKQELGEINDAYDNFVTKTQGVIKEDIGQMSGYITDNANRIMDEAKNLDMK